MMKKQILFTWLIVVGFMAIISSCQEKKEESPADLSVVEQKDSVVCESGEVVKFAIDASVDGTKAWMEVDTVNHVLMGYVDGSEWMIGDTITTYNPDFGIYPKGVYTIHTDNDLTVYMFIYSTGYLLYYDEAVACVAGDNGFEPVAIFAIDGGHESTIGSMWFDQLVAASDGFPFGEENIDEDRFGIYYDHYAKRLYVPIMEHHEEGSGFENCLRYTGRFNILQFNGEEFVPDGTDGAWWINPEYRNYKRTISNKKTAKGIEQVDLMPDGTLRHCIWEGAKTLDNLRRKPSSCVITNNN